VTAPRVPYTERPGGDGYVIRHYATHADHTADCPLLDDEQMARIRALLPPVQHTDRQAS